MNIPVFGKKAAVKKGTVPAGKKPVIKCSICNGEQVAGFRDLHSGAFEEVMLISNASDQDAFKSRYGITGDMEKIY